MPGSQKHVLRVVFTDQRVIIEKHKFDGNFITNFYEKRQPLNPANACGGFPMELTSRGYTQPIAFLYRQKFARVWLQ